MLEVLMIDARQLMENAGCAAQRRIICDDPVVVGAILRSFSQFLLDYESNGFDIQTIRLSLKEHPFYNR